MAKEIKTFGSKGQKADEMLNRIQTPTDQAIGGGVAEALGDFVKDTNAQMLGAFFGTMVTGTKMNKGAFDGMMGTIVQKNIFNKINGSLENLYTQLTGDEKTLYGHIVKMSETIQLISDGLLSYFAMVPTGGSQEGSMTYNITLDTTKAEDFDKILKAVVELAPENVKNVEKLFNAASQISYIDMSSLQKNFIEPLNALDDLKYADIIKITNELVDSDMFLNLQDIFSMLSGISFSNGDIESAFSALDTFTASLIKYNELDISSLKILPEKLQLIMSIINADAGNAANLNDLFKKLNDIGEVDPKVYAAIKGLVVATAHLLLFSDGLDKTAEKDIIDSIESLNTIIEAFKTKIVLSDTDKEAIKASINALKECTIELSGITPDIQKSGEDIVKVFGEYNTNIDLALKSSQSANEKMNQLVDTYKATNEKMKESDEIAKGTNYKDISVTLSDLGTVILLMGLTMMLGGYLITKNPELIIGSFKFALTLAAFMTVIMVPIFLINFLYSKAGVTQQAMGEVTKLVSGMAFIMIIGGLIYKWLGDDLSKNAMRFAIDMAKFLILVMIPVALVGLIAKPEVLKDMNAVGNFIMKAALVMIIGALIVQNRNIVEASLQFGVVLGAFIFLTLLPILAFGAIVRNDAMKYISDIGIFIVTCTIVMLIGALFMNNDKLWKQSLRFGLLVAAFVGLVLLPVLLFAVFVNDPKTLAFIHDITTMIISFSLMLMIGGLFMTWGNGKYAVGAMKFALLLFVFTTAMVLTIAVVSRIVNEKALLAIRQFTKMVTMFSVLLIVGALFMMLPGFGLAAISFAALIFVFTALMGIVLVMIAKSMTKDAMASVAQFGIMVLLLSFALIVGGLTVQMIGLAPILIFAAMVAVMVGIVILYVKLTSKINPMQMLKSMAVIVLFSVSMLILSAAIWAAKKAVTGFEWGDIAKLLVIVAGLVAVFALIGIPYVAALVALGSLVVTAMGVALTVFSGALWIVHKIVSGFDGGDIYEEILILCGVVGILSILFSLIGPLSLLIIPASVAIAAMSVSITLFAGAMELIHIMCKHSDEYLNDLSQTMIIIGILGALYALIGVFSPAIVFGSGAIFAMSVSLLAFSGVLELIHRMISFNTEIIGEVGILIACAGMLGALYTLIGVFSPAIVFGSGAIVAMSVSMLIFASVLELVSRIISFNASIILDIGIMIVCAGLLGAFYTVIGFFSPFILAASVAMAALSVSLSLFAGAIWIVNTLIGPQTKESLINAAVMSTIMGLLGAFYTLIGVFSPFIVAGSAALTALSVSLTLFSGALWIVNALIGPQTVETLKNTAVMSAILIAFGSIYTALGALSPLIALGSVAITALSVSLTLFAGVLALINVMIGENKDILKQIGVISLSLVAMGGVFTLLGALSPVIAVGAVVLSMLSGALMLFDIAIGGIVFIIKSAQEIDTGKLDKFGEVLSGFFAAVRDSLPGPIKLLKMIAKVSGVTLFIRPLSGMMAALASAVKDFASLNIPIEWDEKTGKAIKYKQLTSNDFKQVITNVGDIIDTFLGALENIYSKHSKTIDEATNSSMFALFFGSPKSSLLKTIRVASMLGRCIGTLAENLANIAQLMIPDDWNQEGKPIHFRPMKEKDFDEAGKGIGKIISTVGEALIKFGDDHSDWVKDFQENDRKGWFKKSEGNSKFGAVLRMSIGLSDMISKIAAAIGDYAQLKVPTGFDSSGNATGYRKIKNKDFVDSANNIETIMEHFGKAIANGYENGFSRALKKTERLEKMFTAITDATGLLSSVAEILQKISSMEFDEYNILGQPTGKKVKLNYKLIYIAADNIEDIMTAFPNAISRAYKKFDTKEGREAIDDIAYFMRKMKPMGEFISNIVDAIQNYANLKIPTKYNSEGKAIEFRPLKLDESLGAMSKNLEDIMVGMGNALAKAYAAFEMEDKSPQTVAKAIEAMKPVGEIFTNLMNAVQAYADFKIPLYEDKKDKSKITGYKTFENGDLTEYFGSMEKNLVSLLEGMVKCISSPKVTSILDDIIKKDYSEYYASINTINDVIGKVLETVQKYSELKIPKGELDKEGKPKDGYYTLDSIPKTWYVDLAINLADLIWAMPFAIKLAFDYFNQKNGETKIIDQIQEAKNVINDIMTSASSVMQSVFDIIQKYADLKIPKEFNKDGTVKSYLTMNSDSIKDMKQCIFDIVTAIPNAMNAVFKVFTQNKIGDNELRFIKNIINENSYDIMVGASKLVEEYNKIKKEIQGVKSKDIIGKFINNIAEMYVDLALVFKNSKATPEDIENSYKYINAILNDESIQALDMICSNIDKLVTVVYHIRKSVINKGIMDILIIKAVLNKQMFTNIFIAKAAIIKTIETLVKSLQEIETTIQKNPIPRRINKRIDQLNEIADIYKELKFNLSYITRNINNINDTILNDFKGFDDKNFEDLFVSIMKSLINIDDVITKNYEKRNFNKQIKKFDNVIDSFDSYKDSLLKVRSIFDQIKNAFEDYNTEVFDNITTQIKNAILTVLQISKIIENPTLLSSTTDKVNNNMMNTVNKQNANINKLVLDFAIMAVKLDKGITLIAQSVDKIGEMDNPSLDPIENMLNVVCEHAMKLDEKNINKFDKESSALDKFTKSIERTNTAKVNSLIKLFEAMEKWSESVGNLDEFTRALSDELSGTLQKLTAEITDAKKVIKTADQQRAKRQKQLEETMEKIEKLMNQTLHVNVSQEKGNALSTAWEKPND